MNKKDKQITQEFVDNLRHGTFHIIIPPAQYDDWVAAGIRLNDNVIKNAPMPISDGEPTGFLKTE